MDQSLIAWMIDGGERSITREDRRQWAHRVALREATVVPHERPAFGGLFDRFTSRSTTAAPTAIATDCCAA